MAWTDTLTKYGPALEDFSTVAGNIAAGRASGRLSEADYGLQRQTAIQNARRAALGEALRGGALQGVQDVNFSGLPYGVTVPEQTGGLRPSAITNRDQIGKSI